GEEDLDDDDDQCREHSAGDAREDEGQQWLRCACQPDDEHPCDGDREPQPGVEGQPCRALQSEQMRGDVEDRIQEREGAEAEDQPEVGPRGGVLRPTVSVRGLVRGLPVPVVAGGPCIVVCGVHTVDGRNRAVPSASLRRRRPCTPGGDAAHPTVSLRLQSWTPRRGSVCWGPCSRSPWRTPSSSSPSSG